ncbi:twin-arginine translocation pathway signal [Calothrix parasitica NIES-267]|uniref:Twin-arginine translocation pathway signal n=1 Tax=Calothrix parasitica NIES-267 TaxID=1973488 RepID=A0A1Z4LPR8_9CYAN|nr:twin-arginine translocation pathway signal [Calothrix parasitica NIES-267]
MKRRKFIQQAGIFSASSLVAVGTNAWVSRNTSSANSPNSKRLIVIFLRGAVDGLSVVVPYTENAYYQARKRIAIPQPGKAGGVLDLDGKFGLHPSLAALMPLWKQKNLAFVHACGSPESTRSHFDAQEYMETGTPGIKTTKDGWMNRLLAAMTVEDNPIQAVNVGSNIPRILAGNAPVATIPAGRRVAKRLPIDNPQLTTAFDKLYSGDDALSKTYRDARESREALMETDVEMKLANNGAPLPKGFSRDAQRLARLMVRDSRIELAFLALGGWDTHINQGNSKGQLSQRLQRLGDGLATLQKELGEVYQNTNIVVISEFGRTVKENGNGGTDHGHGNVMWLLGGKISGGKVYGDFPGLSNNQLHQGRDLAITTDFRDVIATLLQNHMNLDKAKINKIFPNHNSVNSHILTINS